MPIKGIKKNVTKKSLSTELTDKNKLQMAKKRGDKDFYLKIKKVDDRAQYKEMVKQLKELTPISSKDKKKRVSVSASNLYLQKKQNSVQIDHEPLTNLKQHY